MNFWEGDSDEEVIQLQKVFTIGKQSKLNLQPAIACGNATIIYSSCKGKFTDFQVDSESENGWQLDFPIEGEYVGIKVNERRIFYALDIKVLSGNTMKRFAL